MNTQVIIFDFDGTLADVVPHFREIYHKLAPKYKLRTISEVEYVELRKKSIWYVMRWTGLKPWQLPGLLNDGRKLFAKVKKEVELFDGVAEVIIELDKQGHKLYILSSNSEATIRSILRRYGLNDEFKVMKRPLFFAKFINIIQLVRVKKYDRKTTWMIGDEVRDVKAGKRAGVRTVSVTWGLQAREILKTKKPDYITDSVKELSKIFSS